MELQASELAMLLAGIDLTSIKRRRRFALRQERAVPRCEPFRAWLEVQQAQHRGHTAAVLFSLIATCQRHQVALPPRGSPDAYDHSLVF